MAAIDYLDAKRIDADCRHIADRARDEVDTVITEHFVLSYAGEAAIAALAAALDDEYFEPGLPRLDLADAQTDGDDNDAASFAATVLSRGSARNPDSDPNARLSFWNWWLLEAVHAAYRQGTLSPPRGSEG